LGERLGEDRFQKIWLKGGEGWTPPLCQCPAARTPAYQNLYPRIRPWFSITETAYIVGQPTHLHREIAKAEAILDRPSSSSRAAQHKAAVAMAYNLLSWHGYRATTTRGRKWAQLAGILTGDQKVDLFDHLRAFKRRPVPTVEKLRGARAILYWTRR
jgi:hypothetical protein